MYADMDLLSVIELYENKLKAARSKELQDHMAGIKAKEYGLVLEYLYELRCLRLANEQMKDENKLLTEILEARSEETAKLDKKDF